VPNFDYNLLQETEAELAQYGVFGGEDFETVDWRSGEIANHDSDGNFEAGGLVHELVKSFGFRRDPETKSWDWSVSNIGESFKEDPIWTTLDYLLLAVPIAKIGTAATKVARGTGAAAKTLEKAEHFREVMPTIRSRAMGADLIEGEQAARFLGEVQPGRRARVAEKVAGWVSDPPEGFAEAVELEMRHGVARNAASRWFASNVAKRGVQETFDPVTRTFASHVDPEWENLIKTSGGGDPFERRALYDVMAREAASERTMYERMGEELIRMENKVLKTDEQKAAFGLALERGEAPEDILRAFGKDEGYLAAKLTDFRLRIHEKSHNLGLISDETYEWGLEKYWPRVWKEMEEARVIEAAAAGRKFGAATGAGGRQAGRRFQHRRKLTPEEADMLDATEGAMNRAIDPAAGVSALMEAGSFVAGQAFLQRMAGSTLVADGSTLIDNIVDLARGTPADELDAALKQRFFRTYPKRNIDQILREVDYARAEGKALSRTATEELVEKVLGWRKIDDALKAAGVKGYMSRVPPGMKGKYVDPTLARDLAGMGAFVEALPAAVRQVYMTAMTHFKASKTAYNPATHIRNWFGAFVFHHLTVGGIGPMGTGFRRGWKALYAGSKPHADPDAYRDFEHIMEAGFANSSFDREIHDTIRKGLDIGADDAKRVTALDWLKVIPGLKESKALEKGLDVASWAERKYRFVDELAKADAFLVLRDRYVKALTKEAAAAAKVGESIKGAAIKADGKWYRGRTHGEAFDKAFDATPGGNVRNLEDDWFVTSKGRYVRRAEASQIAKAADQLPATGTRVVVEGKTTDLPDAILAEAIQRPGTASRADAIMMEARGRAAAEVVKYQPVFHQNSPFTNMVRNAIPFSSFTTEALRVWKNAMVEKPHWAFFYNHMAEAMSQMLGAVAGFDTADLEAAKSALPEYAQNKKMVVLPFRVDGKPTFLDLSYMLPMGNLNESAAVEASFFDRVHMDPFSANPFLSFGYALKTGKDPFSGQPIEPRFMEQQLGLDVPTKGMGRKALGMAEHTMKMALPPLLPPGYAGMNLYELARGQKHPVSGAQLEDGVLRTVAANALGLRTYEADVSAQLLNVRREKRRLQDEVSVQWRRWQFGHANGKVGMMDESLEEIRQLRIRLGDDDKAVNKYLLQGVKRREAGKWRGVSTRHIEEVMERSKGIMTKGPEDLKMMSELSARYKERALRTRAGKEALAE
jgi:hypothetical protein